MKELLTGGTKFVSLEALADLSREGKTVATVVRPEWSPPKDGERIGFKDLIAEGVDL